MSELELIRWIRSRHGRRGGRIIVDSGDDCAVVRIGRVDVLFKTDSVIEGVHFVHAAKPEEIGHKAVARCLSDVAAMGGVPSFAVAAVMAPQNARAEMLRGIVRGMDRTAARFGVAVVGGDVAVHAGKLAINVAMIGEMGGRQPILRRGARPGDAICVTGPLGGSILGKHLRFTPRVREARDLCGRLDIHAMIDISDGLARDLSHICEESGVGAVLEEARIPVSAAARRIGGAALEHALFDGEDYELLYTLPKAQTRRSIGEITEGRGIKLRRRDGRLEPLSSRGWEHRFGR